MPRCSPVHNELDTQPVCKVVRLGALRLRERQQMMTTMNLSDDEVKILEIIRQIDPGERPRVVHYLTEMASSQPPADPSEEFRMHSKRPSGEPGWKFMEDV